MAVPVWLILPAPFSVSKSNPIGTFQQDCACKHGLSAPLPFAPKNEEIA